MANKSVSKGLNRYRIHLAILSCYLVIDGFTAIYFKDLKIFFIVAASILPVSIFIFWLINLISILKSR